MATELREFSCSDFNYNRATRGNLESQNHRRRAQFHAEKRKEFFLLSQNAYLKKNFVNAKRYSRLGKQQESLMNEANEEANEAVYSFNNGRLNTENTIDLHGLFVKEALDRLSSHLDLAKAEGLSKLFVIVGRGLHSNGGPKLKPAVVEYARQQNIVHYLHPRNEGCVIFLIDQAKIRDRKVQVVKRFLDQEPKNVLESFPRRNDSPSNSTWLFILFLASIFMLMIPNLFGKA